MILVTGGGGFFGRNIARYLVDRGKKVLLLQRSPYEVLHSWHPTGKRNQSHSG